MVECVGHRACVEEPSMRAKCKTYGTNEGLIFSPERLPK